MLKQVTNLQKLSKVAKRQQHYGIRKLTIGAASVLLGTTLWLGRDAITVEAADENTDNDSNDAKEESNSNISTPTIDDNTKAVVNTTSSDDSSNSSSDISTSKEVSPAANDLSSSQNASKFVTTDKAAAQSSSTNSAVTTDEQKSNEVNAQSSSSIESKQANQVQSKISQKQDNSSLIDSKAAANAGSTGAQSIINNKEASSNTINDLKTPVNNINGSASKSNDGDSTLTDKNSQLISVDLNKLVNTNNNSDIQNGINKLKQAKNSQELLNTLNTINIPDDKKNIVKDAIASNKMDLARSLATSLVEQSDNSTNGGFDEDTWGTLNVDDWDTKDDGTYLELTGYKGTDYNHIIVPNAADFENAGLDDNDEEVGVTSDLMHNLFLNADSQNATVAFSKTNGDQVAAIDDNWFNTWGHGKEDDPNDTETQATAKLSYFDGSSLDTSNISNMSYMFADNNLDDISSLSNWDTSNTDSMDSMFWRNQISDLTPVSDWLYDGNNVENIDSMFASNQIADLSPVQDWDTSNIENMANVFYNNQISDLTPISAWDTSSATNMDGMFSKNPVTKADFSNWDFSNLNKRDLRQTAHPYSSLDGFIDSDARAIINLGDNNTLPDWLLENPTTDDDGTNLGNDNIFSTSNGNHLILTSDQNLLNNPNGAYNTINFDNGDSKQIPVFINTTPDNALNYVTKLAQKAASDEKNQLASDGNNYNVVLSDDVDQNDPISMANADYNVSENIAPVTPSSPAPSPEVSGNETITFVDNNGNTLINPVVIHHTFSQTDESFTYHEIKVPVITGYVADKKTAGGKTGTYDKPNTTDQVTYTQVGKIIPVDQNNNRIQNAPTLSYINDSSDPTKVVADEEVPVVSGYTSSVTTVTPTSATDDTPVIYTPETPKGSIEVFVHDNTTDNILPQYSKSSGSEVIGTAFTYDKNDVINQLTQAGYKVDNNPAIPSVITRGDQQTTIEVEHTFTDISAGNSQTSKNIKRTITVINPGGDKYDLSQSLRLHRSALRDNVTKHVTYGRWNTGHFDEVDIPKITGYTASQNTVPAVTNVSADYVDPNIQIVYTKNVDNNTTEVINYIDNSTHQQVGNQILHGKVGQAISFTPDVPDGYDLPKDQQVQVTFTAGNTNTTNIPVIEHIVTVKPNDVTLIHSILGINNHDQRTATVLPGTKNKYANGDIVYSDLHKTRQRSIIIVNPDGSLNPKSIIQTIDFQRSASINAITGVITFGKWTPVNKDSFSKLTVPNITGYVPTQTQIAEVDNVANDYIDPHIVVRYQGLPTIQEIVYKDNKGKTISSQVIKGQNGQVIKITPDIPDGYQLLQNQVPPKQIALKQNNQTIELAVTPITITVDPDQITTAHPVSINQIISGTRNKHLVQPLTYQDLHKVVTRTITIKRPNGLISPDSITQIVHFTRTAIINAATGKVTYSGWIPEGNATLSAINVPTIAGYTSNGQVPSINKVTSDYIDPKITITYTPTNQKQEIVYKDKQGNIVGQQEVNGKTDQTVAVNLQAPDGYAIDKKSKAPNQIKLSVNTKPITVTVTSKRIVIKPDQISLNKPILKNEVIPGTTTKHASQDISYGDLHKDVSRAVIITLPNGQQKKIDQTVHFERSAEIDTATGKVNFDDWQVNGNDNFDKVDLPQENGYIATGDVSEIDGITNDDSSQTVKIGYITDTPTNRLQVAKDSLANLQQAQKQIATKLIALQLIQARAGKTAQLTQVAIQKQQNLVKTLWQKANDTKNLLASLLASNQVDQQQANAATQKVSDLNSQISDKENQRQSEQTKLNEQNSILTADKKKKQQLIGTINDINSKIQKVNEIIAQAQEILDMQKDYAHATLKLSPEYVAAVTKYEQACDKLFNSVYNSEKASQGDYNAKVYGFDALMGGGQYTDLMSKVNSNFYNAIQNAGQDLLRNLYNISKKDIEKRTVAQTWNNNDANEIVDLAHITPEQEKEINDYTFVLLNNIRQQLNLPQFVHSSSTEQLAENIAQRYLKDGHSIFNIDAHDAKAVNDCANEAGLGSYNLSPNDYISHDEKYESMAGWDADANLILMPNDKGNIGISLYPGNESTYKVSKDTMKSGKTNMDSVKQGIFANMLQMILDDASSGWGHTEGLLNLGTMKDYFSNKPEYFLGTAMSILQKNPPEKQEVIDEGGYTGHFIDVAKSDIKKGSLIKADGDSVSVHMPTAAEIEKAEKNLTNGSKELTAYNQQLSKLQKQLNIVDADIKDHTPKAEAIKTKLSEIDSDLNNLKKQLSAAKNAQTTANSFLNRNTTALQAQKDVAEKAQEDGQKNQTILDDMKNKAITDNNKTQIINQEIAKLQERSKQCQNKIDSAKKVVDKIQKQVNNQQQQQQHRSSGQQPNQGQPSSQAPVSDIQNNNTTSASDTTNNSDQTVPTNTTSTNNSASSTASTPSSDDSDEKDSDDSDVASPAPTSHHKNHSSSANNSPRGESNRQGRRSAVAAETGENNQPRATKLSFKNTANEAESTVSGLNNSGSSTLPQTGEDNDSLAAALTGAVAISISLIGLAGVRKRRN